jgi:hypothetical protein
MIDVLSVIGLMVAMFVIVPLLAYGLSALVDRITRRGGDDNGDEGGGGLSVPRQPGPSGGPPASVARSAEVGPRDEPTSA